MGGNVKFGNISASKISYMNRNLITTDLIKLLNIINSHFSIRFKCVPWKNISSNQIDNIYFSGSSYHFFDSAITDDEYKKYKPNFGDIDIQIDRNNHKNFLSLIEYYKMIKFSTDEFELIDYKKSNEQIISLWKHSTGNIQIDFEFVNFEQHVPSDWSTFSRYSSWDDVKLGIKGVFHKLLIRALTGKHLKALTYYDTNKVLKKEVCSFYAFSVVKGLRYKFTNIEKNNKQYLQKLKPFESEYITDVNKIASLLFEKQLVYWNDGEQKKMYSFSGLVDLINKYCSSEEKNNIISAFEYSLFYEHAQQISNDINEDKKIKNIALTYIKNNLKIL